MSDRVPLDERLHGRDLEAAIVLSLLNTEAGPKEHASQGVYWLCNSSFNSFLQFVEMSVFTFIQELHRLELWWMKTQIQRL